MDVDDDKEVKDDLLAEFERRKRVNTSVILVVHSLKIIN